MWSYNFFLLLSLATSASCARDPLPIRIIQHNVRADGLSSYPNERPWPVRLAGQISELSFHLRTSPPDTFITMQEVKDNQLQDILTNLNRNVTDKYGSKFTRISNYNSNGARLNAQRNGRLDYDITQDARLYTGPGEWSYVGVGRDDGKYGGEYSPIFYRPSRWTLMRWETSWFAANSTYPNKSWGGSNNRLVTVGLFQSTDGLRTVAVMAAHLDDAYPWDDDYPRAQSLSFLSNTFDWWTGRDSSSPYKVPCILGADFNGELNDPGYPNIKNGTGNGNILEELQRDVAGNFYKIWGPLFTYTGFGGEYFEQPLDYIFVSPWEHSSNPPSSYWSIEGYAVSNAEFGGSNDTVDGGDLQHKYNDNPRLNSDHRMIIGDLSLA